METKTEKVKKRKFKQWLFDEHPRIFKAWFWLTCWRPVTKYEHASLARNILIHANANQISHAKMTKILSNLTKTNVEDNKEGENRGMYE